MSQRLIVNVCILLVILSVGLVIFNTMWVKRLNDSIGVIPTDIQLAIFS